MKNPFSMVRRFSTKAVVGSILLATSARSPLWASPDSMIVSRLQPD